MNDAALKLSIINLNLAKRSKTANPNFLAYLEKRVKIETNKNKLISKKEKFNA